MYNTLLLIIFTTLCNWSQKWNHVPPVWDFVILDHHFAIFPLPASVATILISAIMSLVVLDVTYKWGQVFVFLCQAYIMFSNYTYGVTNDRIPFSRQIIFQCVCVCVCVSMHHFSFIHSSAGGHLGWFHHLTFVTSAAMPMGIQISLPHIDFKSFW
jgi:hypothetical protein